MYNPHASNEPIIEISGVAKSYPGVRALKGVSFAIARGTVHCLVGENGAGKSTLIKILTGAEKHDEGSILWQGQTYQPKSIKDAMRAGMSVLYQELNIVDSLTVRENLVLGKEKSRWGIVQRSDIDQQAIDILRSLDANIDPDTKASAYSVAQKQVMQIAKAIADECQVLIMDEPTAALTEEEIQQLFRVVGQLKEKGVTIVYVSHRLEEIFAIGDNVTVLRDGEVVATKSVQEIGDRQELIRLMLGKVVYQSYVPRAFDRSKVILEVKDLRNRVLNGVSFELHQGEILGFYGLIGSGKTEIARAIYGADPVEGGVLLGGADAKSRLPRHAIRRGISLVPEERRTEGIFPVLPIRENVSLMNTKKILSGFATSLQKERALAQDFIQRLHIATDSMEKAVAYLSGGNQQKVVLAKCINADAKVLMLDEPTRGVDIGAKEEIHNIIRTLADEGTSILVFSSELMEIVNLCDRILLLFNGEIKAELQNGEDIDSETVMHIVTGGA